MAVGQFQHIAVLFCLVCCCFGSGRLAVETGFHESQTGLELLCNWCDPELLILLSALECWDHRYMPPHSTQQRMLGMYST